MQPFRYLGIRQVTPFVCVFILYLVFEFWLGLELGSPVRAHLLSLSIDTGIGIDPVLSCGNDAGVAHGLDEEEESITLEPQFERSFPYYTASEYLFFFETWFLTTGPLKLISVILAKLFE